MSFHSKSPLGQRITTLTERVDQAFKDIPNLMKLCKQKSSHRLNIPRHPNNSKSTVDFAIQNTDKPKFNTESTLKLQFRNIKIQNKLSAQITQPSSQRTIYNQQQEPVINNSTSSKIKTQNLYLDLSKINHNQNMNLIETNYTPINKLSKTSRPINFRSLSNINLDQLSPYTPLTDRKAYDISPTHIDLRLLEVTSHKGYHHTRKFSKFIENPRIIIGEEMKHKVAMMMKKRVEVNKENPHSVKKHTRENSCIKLRDTLIKKVANIAGILN